KVLISAPPKGDEPVKKILTWYDNEYGFSNRMLDVAEYIT
uniref:Glyceraldehyde 3-phosphate dehydrogenase (Fragments) n=1 Tax=Haloarcula vallismortis TaxID=28442 RepID=Q9UWN0_HALVA